MSRWPARIWLLAAVAASAVGAHRCSVGLAGEAPAAPAGKATPDAPLDAFAAVEQGRLRKLVSEGDVWVDLKRRIVVLGGQVCLRAGMLEMFACPKNTKEHESIVAVNAKARFVHAALLAVGAKPGRPVRFQPAYQAASGQAIGVEVQWRDAQGRLRRSKAQDWIRNIKTGKPMQYDWVFAGSGFWKDPDSGREYYMADSGDLICVSNFPSATLDLPVLSPQENSQLLYEAFTDRIPPLGTPVRLVLRPRTPPAAAKP